MGNEISNALTLYILFNTDSQEALEVTTTEATMITAVSDYGEIVADLELRIYTEEGSGDIKLTERIPCPVYMDGLFVTKTSAGIEPIDEDLD